MRGYNRTLGVAAAVFLAACVGGFAQLYWSHPAEDAFILFEYAENLAHGHGLVYYGGGPRTEGATDFLWLILLSFSVVAGADVAVAAVLWNALGAALAASLLEREVTRSDLGRRWQLAFLAVPLSVPFIAGAPAAYLGFSSLLYQALVLVLFVVAVDERGRATVAVPWLGLGLALFRPDGAFFAAAFVVVAAMTSFRAGRTRAFILSTSAAVAVGAAYFIGRWRYFGLPLPLPLYVKSHGVLHGRVADWVRQYLPWLKNIGMQFMWLKSSVGPAPLLAALFVVMLPLLSPRCPAHRSLRRALIGGFASLVFLGALSVAFQVQNVHFRYQAPVTLLVLYLLAGTAARRIAEAKSTPRRAALFAVLIAGLAPAVAGGARAIAQDLRSRSYIDVFPSRLSAILQPGRRIALTDAGRLAYWTDTPTIDVPGLNHAPTALRPPSVELLRQIDPDVLLIHPGAAIVAEALEPDDPGTRLWQVPPERIRQRIAPPHREVFEGGLDEYRPTSNTATIAAVVMLRYLVERGDQYVIESVFYQGGYRHIVAFRVGLPETDALRAALEESTTGLGYASYAALKGFPLARRFDTQIDDNPGTPVRRGAD